jgi:hypothetical protein
MAWDAAGAWSGVAGAPTQVPVPVSEGGTGGTSQATGRSGLGLGSAAVAALVTDGSTASGALGGADPRVDYATRIQKGLMRGSKRLSGAALFLWPGAASGGNVAYSADTSYYRPFMSLGGNLLASLRVDVTTAAAAGKRITIALYDSTSTGLPGNVIAYITLTVGAIAAQSPAFSAWTIVDSTYFTSNQLDLKPGWSGWVGVAVEAAVSLRSMAPSLSYSGGSNLQVQSYSKALAYTTTPAANPTGLSAQTSNAPLITFSEV